jgi:YVTN family beta-propeller protein
MLRWRLVGHSGRLTPVGLVVAGLVLEILLPSPLLGAEEPASFSVHSVPGVSQSVQPTIAGLRFTGETSLGPPGIFPANIAYDSVTHEMFVSEASAYLLVLSESPLRVSDAIALGNNTSSDALAFDAANNTIFVGVSPTGIDVVSGSTYAIVAHVALSFEPSFLTYDSANRDVLAVGALESNLTVINGTTYAVSVVALELSSYDPIALAFDPITGYEVEVGESTVAFGAGVVFAFSPTNGTSIWSDETLGPEYAGLAIDAGNGSVLTELTSPSTLLELNGDNGKTISQIAVPIDCGPTTLAYDPISADVLVGGCNDRLESLNASTGIVQAPLAVEGSPTAVAVDLTTGDAYVLSGNTSSVSVVTASCSMVLSLLAVGGDPSAVAIDSATGTAYVASTDNVSIINVSDQRLLGSLPLGASDAFSFLGSTQAILFDPATAEVFVANSGSDTVGVISTRSNSVIANVTVAPGPVALAWNQATNDVYVACENWTVASGPPAVLDEISGSTLRVTTEIPLGTIAPGGIAFDDALDELFIANTADFAIDEPPELLVLSAATNEMVATIPFPSSAWTLGQVVYDNFTGDLDVAGAGMGGWTSSPDDFVVNASSRSLVGNFSVGLEPAGVAVVPGTDLLLATAAAPDTVKVVNASSGQSIYSAILPPNSLPWGVAYDPSTQQTFAADSGNDSIAYLSSGEFYPVTFSESGLAPGTNWAVTLGSKTHALLETNSSTGPTIAFTEPNGTYAFTVGSVLAYSASPTNGSFTVHGIPVAVSVTFRPTVTGGASSSTAPGNAGSALLGGVMGGAMVALTILIQLRRRGTATDGKGTAPPSVGPANPPLHP